MKKEKKTNMKNKKSYQESHSPAEQRAAKQPLFSRKVKKIILEG